MSVNAKVFEDEGFRSELFKLAEVRQSADDLAAQHEPEFGGFMSHLGLMRNMSNQAPPGWAYRNYYDMVIRESTGPRMEPLVLPDYYEVMEKQQCFYNAWRLCLESDDLIYCEGWAQYRTIPLEHAWVEEADGSIVDPTWAGIVEGYEEGIYLGIRFTSELALRLSAGSGWTSVMQGDQHNDNQILRRGLKMHNGIAVDLNEEPT